MKKVLIPTKLDKIAAELLKDKAYSVIQDADASLEELAAANPDTEVLIVRSEKVTPDIIDSLPKLSLVVRAGAGYNTIDTKYARGKNVDVMNTPGANSNAVAEEVIALALAASRHILEGDSSTRAGKWEKKRLMGKELSNKTVGILGMGNIGRLVVKLLAGFNVKVLAYDPVLSAELAGNMGVELCSAEKIFENSDYVTLHIPETPETKGMIDKKLFELMKPGAVLINCARAGVVNEDDLRAVKKDKGIIFCNDVYPKDAEGEKSVADIADIMLPHLGASTVEANFNAAKRAAEQTIDYFEKGVANCVVNKGVPDGLDAKYQELAFALAKLARNYLGTEKSPHQISTSFYGELGKYSEWLLAPIVAGISPEFNVSSDATDALALLQERGIVVENRAVDDGKKYGESMTIDLFKGDDTIAKVSVRGTIAENHLMISRLNDFDKLYLEASGNVFFVEYADEPGVIGKIASILGDNHINIVDLRAPQSADAKRALAVIKTNKQVTGKVRDEVEKAVDTINAFDVTF
ncbi:MAG: ACT domain-containing protein [Kiritimatiellaeota bacterium]|nr:ACT domain-containing protein [Kiritimatiellota bacterium]